MPPFRASAIWALSVLTLAASCAKERGAAAPSATSSTGAKNLVAVQPVGSLDEAMAQIQSSTLTCPTEGGCPANVGMLLAADAAGGLDPGSDAVLGCTAALVGDDLVLTNSHCVPSAVKLLPDLCHDRVRVVLPPAGNHPEETFACKKLLGFSPRETATSPDLALIQLDRPTKRAPLALDRGGVQPGATLWSFRVTPDLKARTGTLAIGACRAVDGSYRMPIYNAANDPMIVTGDCQAVPGNSGSPLMGADGKLHALLQADLPLSDPLRADWGQHLADKDFSPLALGTSLRCLANDPSQGWAWDSTCVTITPDDVAAARPRLRQLLNTDPFVHEADTFLVPFRAQSPLVGWNRAEDSTSALDRVEHLAPSCLRPVQVWSTLFAPEGAELPEQAEVSFQIPRYSLSVRFNRYLQLLDPQTKLEKTEIMRYTFSPKTAAVEGKAVFQPVSDGGQPLALPSCPNP